jgi:hypothetical protein
MRSSQTTIQTLLCYKDFVHVQAQSRLTQRLSQLPCAFGFGPVRTMGCFGSCTMACAAICFCGPAVSSKNTWCAGASAKVIPPSGAIKSALSVRHPANTHVGSERTKHDGANNFFGCRKAVISPENRPGQQTQLRKAAGRHPRGGCWLRVKCAVIGTHGAGSGRVAICDSMLCAHQLLALSAPIGAGVSVAIVSAQDSKVASWGHRRGAVQQVLSSAQRGG